MTLSLSLPLSLSFSLSLFLSLFLTIACVKGILSMNEDTIADTHRTSTIATSSCLSSSTCYGEERSNHTKYTYS